MAEPVQSVIRALQLLEDLNRRPFSTVADLHKAAGLPKSTIVRLLQTLIDAGFVHRDDNQAGYRVTSKVPSLSCGFQRDPMVVEAGRSAAMDLTRSLKWPASIALFDKDAIVVRYSTAPQSPFAPFHSTVNMRLSLATRALGRAFLAHCDDTEIDSIARVLSKSDNEEDQQAFDRHGFFYLLRAIRDRGFAERCRQVKPQTSTVAVPIMQGNRVQASLGMTYFTSALEPDDVRRTLLPRLREARETIERRLQDLVGAPNAAEPH